MYVYIYTYICTYINTSTHVRARVCLCVFVWLSEKAEVFYTSIFQVVS